MTNQTRLRTGFLLALAISPWVISAQNDSAATENYLLGPGDQLTVSIRDRKEIEIKPSYINLDGTVEFQYVGRLKAAGMDTSRLAREIEEKLSAIVQNPKVTVDVSVYGSQPVSILGAVARPGTYQIHGRANLVEALSLGEGLKPEAGNVIKITRPISSGPIPLANAKTDATGQFMTAEVSAKRLMDATIPEDNIQVRPHDIITVPRAELVYVLGNVHRPGGFPLAERESMTVLQALALAEGTIAGAVTQNAHILRTSGTSGSPVEIPIDVKKMLASKAPDQPLLPNDILFIPNSASRSVGVRLLETGLQMATGVVVWGRF